jgi:signal transduction histidine kinase
MIFIYSLLAVGTGLGIWAVADLALAGHLLEAVSLLGLVLLTSWCGAVFVRRAPRSTGLAFVGFSLALSLELAGHMAGGQAPNSIWVWVNYYCALAGGPFYLELVTRFPLPRPKLRWLVALAYGVSGTVAVIGPLGLLGPVFDPMHPLAVAARELHYRGGGHSVYAMSAVLVFAGMQGIGLWVLWRSRQQTRKGEAPRVARQALILMLGTLLGWVPAVPFLPNVLPPELELVLHGPPALFFALIPLSGVAALINPDFYDERGIFRRALIGIVLMSGAYLLYIAQVRPLTLLLDQIQPGFGHEPAVFGAAIVVALLIRPMQEWITDQVDRLFFPHLLGFRTLLQEASQALATTIMPGDLAKLATETLPLRLGASNAALLVLDQLGADLISLAGTPLRLSSDHAVWKKAYQAEGPTMLREAVDCTPLGLTAPALMLPLRVGGRLVGIYLLGARHSGMNYTRDELGQLKVLGNHLAVAVENVRALRKIDELSQRALAEVEERNRLAREIHDTIAQGLTAASLQLEVVEATLLTNPARAAKAAERAQSIVRANLAEARRSVLELRAPLLGNESLPAALSRLLNQAAGDIGATGSFQIEGSYRGLPARIENQLYRIAQEALHNAVKYSSASHLTVSLRVDERQVSMRIADDGAGFDPAQTPPGNRRGGFGLTGMGERARLLGGLLRIESEPGEGSLVEAIVPLHHREGESE